MSDRDCKNCKHHTEKGCDSWDCNFEQGMTREDAIKRLKLWLICSEEYTEDDVSMNEAIRIAINSLEIDERYELEYEQIEPCEDAISRQAVLDATVKRNSIWNKITNSKGENLEEIILQLPHVNPQVICPSHGIDCEDCPAYEPKTDVLDKIKAEIEDLVFDYSDDYHLGYNLGLIRATQVIDKYKAESEDKK